MPSAKKPRYLTKSRYTLACVCPTKLFYTAKKDLYADEKLDDPFLAALAEGGYQVGELARHYFKGGVEVRTLDYDQSLAETETLLKNDNVIIYEAAVRHGNCFVRIDILVKQGKHLALYEVKSKSFKMGDQDIFWKKSAKNPGLLADWRPYLQDIAFQRYVLSKAMPESSVTAHLALVNTLIPCPVDGLNQKFPIKRDASGRKGVEVSASLADADLVKPWILSPINVDRECDFIYGEAPDEFGRNFEQRVAYWAEQYEADAKIPPQIISACKGCEFVATAEQAGKGLRSGKVECWKACLGWPEAEILGPTALDIWRLHATKKEKLIEERRLKLSEVTATDIKVEAKGGGLSQSERQWLQVQKAQAKDDAVYFDKVGLAAEMERWTFPLHFIDFETAMVPIPFLKGHFPYEGIAFQFSHHVVQADGTVEHKGQFLKAEAGSFPNYDFVRALKKELETDSGTIFRYSAHENTFLNHIYRQLQASKDVADWNELCAFIRSITKSGGDSVEQWEGPRAMVDLYEMVKKYFYAPETNGSISIKAVFPAILNRSFYLKAKYSKPIYGAADGIKSLNFKDHAWVKLAGREVLDPYSTLPPVFEGIDNEKLDLLAEGDAEIKEGGAAMMAYARMQFSSMSKAEREATEKALLKYCELDTMAMVMIYEAWKAWLTA